MKWIALLVKLAGANIPLYFQQRSKVKGYVNFHVNVLKNPVQLTAEVSRRESGKINQWIHLADNPEHKLKLLVALLQPELNYRNRRLQSSKRYKRK